MKTIEELYKEILENSELKAQAADAIKTQKLDEFLKAQGCEATMEEVKAFLESRKEVSPDELESAAGGCDDTDGVLFSIFSFGIGCIFSRKEQEQGMHPHTISC